MINIMVSKILGRFKRKPEVITPPRISWPEYAMKLAEVASIRSEDCYKKVGCCILGKQNQVLSLGYNGPPAGVEIDWSDRDERRKRVCHAEINGLRFIKPGEASIIAVTMCPCSNCFVNIAAYGIETVYYKEEYDKDDFSKKLAAEFGIKLIKI